MHYFPLEWPFLLALFVLLSIIVALVELQILRYAYERMGISPRSAVFILVLTLVGSSINIPLAEFPPERVISGRVVTPLWDAIRGARGAPMAGDGVSDQRRGSADPDLAVALFGRQEPHRGEIRHRRRSSGTCNASIGPAGARSWSRASNFHSSDHRSCLRAGVVLALSGTARLHRRKHGYADWRRHHEFGQYPGTGRTCRINWRGRDIRWSVSGRDCSGATGLADSAGSKTGCLTILELLRPDSRRKLVTSPIPILQSCKQTEVGE